MSAAVTTSAFAEALARVKARVSAAAGRGAGGETPASAASSTADWIAALFDLSSFERDTLLLAALPVLEPDAAALIAEAQGDPRLRLPTVALALSALENSHWSAFAPDAPLRSHGLIEISDEPAASARVLHLPERLLYALLGVDTIDQEVASIVQPLAARATSLPSRDQTIRLVAGHLNEIGPRGAIVQLEGRSLEGMVAVAAGAAAQLVRRVYLVDASVLAGPSREAARFLRLWSREARLSDAVLVVNARDIASPAEGRAMASALARLQGAIVVLVSDPISIPLRDSLHVTIGAPTRQEQAELWNSALGSLAGRLNGTVTRMSTHFTASPEIIATVASRVGQIAESADDNVLASALWRECRAQTRPQLQDLAERLDGRAGWSDLVLPQRQLVTLRAIAAQVRQRLQVYEQWGFAARGGRGLGISGLFVGPSGTGKTLAAEVIGAALDLDVYRIDLSSVVSKWIGDTEKNLRRVFDAADESSAILLFDEADALFGKRSEVKESHDRYANIEVSYLLQRMEAYRGLAILTSNLRSNIDSAFLRRIRFVVEFPFPGDAERREIWQLAFPAETPTRNLEFSRLAQLNVPGGSIRNIALNAAFLAAEAGGSVDMAHVEAAARIEYEKLGKPLTNGELRGWHAEAGHG